MGKIRPVLPFSFDPLDLQSPVDLESEKGRQIFHENGRVNVLINGFFRFPGESFGFHGAFNDLVVFLHRPPLKIQPLENGDRIFFRIDESRRQHFDFARIQLDPNQAQIRKVFPGGTESPFDRRDFVLAQNGEGFFLSALQECLYDVPIGGKPGAKIGARLDDEIEKPGGGTAPVEQNEVLRLQIREKPPSLFAFADAEARKFESHRNFVQGVEQLGKKAHGTRFAFSAALNAEMFRDLLRVGQAELGAVYGDQPVSVPGFGAEVRREKIRRQGVQFLENFRDELRPRLREGAFRDLSFGKFGVENGLEETVQFDLKTGFEGKGDHEDEAKEADFTFAGKIGRVHFEAIDEFGGMKSIPNQFDKLGIFMAKQDSCHLFPNFFFFPSFFSPWQ